MRLIGLVALSAALVALWLPSSGSGVLTPSSPAPSYMSGVGDRMQVLSSRAFTPSKEFTVFNTGNNLNKGPGQKQERLTSIWAKSCEPRKDQLVRFRRDIQIPGPPDEIEFEISPEAAGFSPHPLRRYELEINARIVAEGKLKYPSSTRVTVDDERKLKAFRDGENEIELRVKRNEFPERIRRCNTSKRNRAAVYFTLTGKFASDLGLVEPAPTAPQYHRAAKPSRTLTVNLRVFNRGPSAMVPGAGSFTADASVNKVVLAGQPTGPTGPGVTPLGAPFQNCQVTGTRVNCELGHMSSGDSGNLSLYVQKEFSSTDFEETTSQINWRTGLQGSDPKFDNNQRSVTIIWCGDKATSPGCASAPGPE